MPQHNVDLATLIGSRICHDLISPIGAISNGIELLELTGSSKGPEFELISDSVANANARIRFFRIAYGAAGGQLLGRPEIVSVLDGMNRSGRIHTLWEPVGAAPRAEVRLAFLALQCCETAMPLGGTVSVSLDGTDWRVNVEAQRIAVDEELWSRLSGGSEDVSLMPAHVQFALLPLAAADMARAVEYDVSETGLELRF